MRVVTSCDGLRLTWAAPAEPAAARRGFALVALRLPPDLGRWHSGLGFDVPVWQTALDELPLWPAALESEPSAHAPGATFLRQRGVPLRGAALRRAALLLADPTASSAELRGLHSDSSYGVWLCQLGSAATADSIRAGWVGVDDWVGVELELGPWSAPLLAHTSSANVVPAAPEPPVPLVTAAACDSVRLRLPPRGEGCAAAQRIVLEARSSPSEVWRVIEPRQTALGGHGDGGKSGRSTGGESGRGGEGGEGGVEGSGGEVVVVPLPPLTPFEFRARAINAAGASAPSAASAAVVAGLGLLDALLAAPRVRPLSSASLFVEWGGADNGAACASGLAVEV